MSFVSSKKKKKPGAENSFQTIVWFKWSEAEECAGQRQRAPTFPQGLRAWEVGWQNSMVPVTADAWLSQGASVAHVAVLVPYDPQEVEAERQQGRAQQVPQSRQVRDGKTVGIFAAPPHGVHHPVWYTQQQQHLEEKERRVNMTIALEAQVRLLLSERMVTQQGSTQSRNWFIHLKLLIIQVNS